MSTPEATLDSPARPVRSDVRVLDTSLRVSTPENISFQYRLAGPFPRVLAYILDVLVTIVPFFLLVVLVWLLFVLVLVPLATSAGLGGLLSVFAGMITMFLLVSYFILYWFYGAVMETRYNGQTLGKRWCKLRVLTVDGHSIDGVQATLRNFFRLLDISPIVPISSLFQTEDPFPLGIPTCLFGLILMTISSKYQRVGDLVAGTIVINEQLARKPGLVKFADERVPQLAEMIPEGYVVSPGLAKTLAHYADQRRLLPHERVTEIAAHIAIPLMDRFEIAPDTNYDLFLCALYHKTFIAGGQT